MPEGPSIVLLKEEVIQFAGKKILSVYGNSKIDQSRLLNQKVLSFKSWGKHFLICFRKFSLRIHFLLFGSYRVNETRPERKIRLGFKFRNGELNFYACSIKFIEGDINSHYDWETDVMSDSWKPAKASLKLKSLNDTMVCDALLEQDIFAGVGNIIKNEVLYRVKIHPESMVDKLPKPKINSLIKESRIYSFQFLEWKRNFELKKHWLAHTRKTCQRCNIPLIRKHTGKKSRRSFFCTNCQVLFK